MYFAQVKQESMAEYDINVGSNIIYLMLASH